ncbi:MAG: TIGR02391 family protein [Vicinamibacterales bacterium]
MDHADLISLGRALQGSVARASSREAPAATRQGSDGHARLLAAFDFMVSHEELVTASRSLFVDGYYARAVEEGLKALNNKVKRKSGLNDDGAQLMNTAFSPRQPILRLNRLKSRSDQDQQLGYMQILAGFMSGIRNPRAHEHDLDDSPDDALAILGFVDHLFDVVEASTRTRRRKAP